MKIEMPCGCVHEGATLKPCSKHFKELFPEGSLSIAKKEKQMRYKIWEKDDFFEIGGQRIDMDPAVVDLPEVAPLTYNFHWDGRPYGKVTEIRLEDGEITGEMEVFNPEWTEDLMRDLRLGGYYKEVEKNEDGTIVTKCRLMGVSLVVLNNMPGARHVKDWRPLSEDVSTHAMLMSLPPHEDGRQCAYHYRLGVWTFDGDKECLREHQENGVV